MINLHPCGKIGMILISEIHEVYMLFDSQNYSPREMQIIYEDLDDVDEKELRRLLDKSITNIMIEK